MCIQTLERIERPANQVYPLRKDVPLLARLVKPWPGIVDVEQMPGETDEGDGEATEGGDAE